MVFLLALYAKQHLLSHRPSSLGRGRRSIPKALMALYVGVVGFSLRGPFWLIRAVSQTTIKRTRSFTEFARSFTESIFVIGSTRCVDLYFRGHIGDMLIGRYSGMISSS